MQSLSNASFVLPGFDPECRVQLTQGLSKDTILNFPPFKQWVATLKDSLATQNASNHAFHKTPYKLRSIEIQAVDIFGGSRIGFIKLKATVTNDDGEWLPGAVFMRGGSVGMLVVLQADDVPADSEKAKYAILTVQPRIAAGSLAFAEIPAGMLDGGTFSGGAAKEIKEETGLQVQESDLVDMTALATPDSKQTAGEVLQRAIYPSPGGCDEYIPLFLCQKRIPRTQLEEFQGKLTGLRDEGEKITLKLVKLEDLWKEGSRDGKTLAAWALYSGLKAEGKI